MPKRSKKRKNEVQKWEGKNVGGSEREEGTKERRMKNGMTK